MEIPAIWVNIKAIQDVTIKLKLRRLGDDMKK